MPARRGHANAATHVSSDICPKVARQLPRICSTVVCVADWTAAIDRESMLSYASLLPDLQLDSDLMASC
eukprot:SAG31_NODE_736_length_12477_cov_60.959363_3_plen_69_part_00